MTTSHGSKWTMAAVIASFALLSGAQPAFSQIGSKNVVSQEQEKLSRKELKTLIASAKTSADHERIAAYYRAESQKLESKQKEHESDLAEYYKNTARYPSKYPTMGDHCRSLATYYKMAAQKAAALAEMHKQLAHNDK